ncbi:MAG: alanine racemase [Clostridia bacterium]|nr:alanine racemase [Clostridia bacterium]
MSSNRFYAKIDLGNIGKNVTGVRNRINPDTMIMAVIKADAYGHGAVQVASYLNDKVDWFGVATTDEALELRKNGMQKNILVLGSVMPGDYYSIVKYDITATIYDFERAKLLSDEAVSQNKTVKIHIKVDTGMSRIGLEANETSVHIVSKIKGLPNIVIEGIFSHLAKADEADKSSAYTQKKIFDDFINMLEKNGINIPIKHLYNSAGIMEMSNSYDMVRMGIMLYGYYPSDEIDNNYKLYPALELISQVSYVKNVNKGCGVSYGHTFIAENDMKIATIPVGYADGYPRCLSGKGEVLINGKRCKIIGRICMDQMMVDVTGLDSISVGDEVVLVGNSGKEYISVEEVANNAYSFNYEFICGISRRVPRVYYHNGTYIGEKSYLER